MHITGRTQLNYYLVMCNGAFQTYEHDQKHLSELTELRGEYRNAKVLINTSKHFVFLGKSYYCPFHPHFFSDEEISLKKSKREQDKHHTSMALTCQYDNLKSHQLMWVLFTKKLIP